MLVFEANGTGRARCKREIAAQETEPGHTPLVIRNYDTDRQAPPGPRFASVFDVPDT